MKEFEFTLVLKGNENILDDSEALYAAFNDGLLSASNRICTVDFSRESRSLEQAIRSAIADVSRAGHEVESVQIDNFTQLEPGDATASA